MFTSSVIQNQIGEKRLQEDQAKIESKVYAKPHFGPEDQDPDTKR
jgi:hypothetical protein